MSDLANHREMEKRVSALSTGQRSWLHVFCPFRQWKCPALEQRVQATERE